MFTPSTEWQDVPDGIAVPPGGHYRVNPNTGLRQARWENPPPADQVRNVTQNAAGTSAYVYHDPGVTRNTSEPILPQRTRDYLAHGAPKGQRNNELFEAACQMRDAGYARADIEKTAGQRAEADGLSEAEIATTLKSVFDRGPRTPIHGQNGQEPSISYPPTAAEPRPQPVALPPPIVDGLQLLLETCFKENENVVIGDTKLNASGEPKPHNGDCYSREEWLQRLRAEPISQIYATAKDGLFIRINPLRPGGKADKDVTAYRHVLAEWDLDAQGNRIPKEVQYALLLKSELPLSTISDSGDKSIHGLICVDAPDRPEYDRRRELIWEYFQKAGLPLDPQNKNPSRYSRCPGVERNIYDKDNNVIGTGRQELLAVNVGLPSWEEWERVQIDRDYTDQELADLEAIQQEKYRIKNRPFPKRMAEEAFYGIAGDITRVIEPVSEACPEAILGQLLIVLGNLMGRTACRKQAGIHHLNEFAVLVGPTSRGRKGTAWNAVHNLAREIDQQWLSERVKDGLQSGEAIIHAVRDPVIGIPRGGKGRPRKGAAVPQVLDTGVDDKRLLVVEEEFGRLLTVASRTGNTISSTFRKCWDGNEWLYVEGKISPEKATGAHISMIGHVTLSELLECLREVENRNGFSNRVLWIATQRTKKIPLPIWINWKKDHSQIIKKLKDVLLNINAVASREMDWSPEGKKAWRQFYNSIPDGDAGVVGSIIARTEAHVLRLTMLYTVLDNSTLMEPKHLKAAIAFWRYCERSAQWAFAEKTGNRMADRIYWALQREPKGMTRQQIGAECFNKHCTKSQLDMAFASLQEANLAEMKLERTQQVKRPTERWFARQ